MQKAMSDQSKAWAEARARVDLVLADRWRVLELQRLTPLCAEYRVSDGRRNARARVLHDGLARVPALRRHFLLILQQTRALQHSGVLAASSYGAEPSGLTFAIEPVHPGARLAEHLTVHAGPVAVDAAVRRVASLLDVLAHAHARGTVHGALDGERLWLLPDDRLGAFDFGAGPLERHARSADPSNARLEIAPERVEADLVAALRVLWVQLAGRPQALAPLGTAAPPPGTRLADEVPSALRQLLERGVAAAGLPPSAAALRADLLAASGVGSVPPWPEFDERGTAPGVDTPRRASSRAGLRASVPPSRDAPLSRAGVATRRASSAALQRPMAPAPPESPPRTPRTRSVAPRPSAARQIREEVQSATEPSAESPAARARRLGTDPRGTGWRADGPSQADARAERQAWPAGRDVIGGRSEPEAPSEAEASGEVDLSGEHELSGEVATAGATQADRASFVGAVGGGFGLREATSEAAASDASPLSGGWGPEQTTGVRIQAVPTSGPLAPLRALLLGELAGEDTTGPATLLAGEVRREGGVVLQLGASELRTGADGWAFDAPLQRPLGAARASGLRTIELDRRVEPGDLTLLARALLGPAGRRGEGSAPLRMGAARLRFVTWRVADRLSHPDPARAQWLRGQRQEARSLALFETCFQLEDAWQKAEGLGGRLVPKDVLDQALSDGAPAVFDPSGSPRWGEASRGTLRGSLELADAELTERVGHLCGWALRRADDALWARFTGRVGEWASATPARALQIVDAAARAAGGDEREVIAQLLPPGDWDAEAARLGWSAERRARLPADHDASDDGGVR